MTGAVPRRGTGNGLIARWTPGVQLAVGSGQWAVEGGRRAIPPQAVSMQKTVTSR